MTQFNKNHKIQDFKSDFKTEGQKLLSLKGLILTLTIFFLCYQNCFASQMPRFLGSEKKFRSYVYNPNEVYRYIGHYTYQGFIEFEGGETISTISMGNPTLWMFEHLNNRLFLKPIGDDSSETNMTVITNKRIYHFELAAKEAKGINDQDLIFTAKFYYPEDVDKNILEFGKAEKSDEPDLRKPDLYNFDYQYVGDNNITPIKVFDDGTFTYFQFSQKIGEVPAIFSVDGSGFEALVNFRSTANYIVVEQISAQFTLRSGSEVVCVYNVRLNQYKNNKQKSSIRKSSINSFLKTEKPAVGQVSNITAGNMSNASPGNMSNIAVGNVVKTQ